MAIILKPEHVAQLVFLIRGEKVMLDAHLAMLSPFCEGIRELEITDCDVRREERSHHLPFEITICDLKTRPRRSAPSTLCVHRTRRSNVIKCWSLARPRSCQLPSLHHRLPARLPRARVLNSERAVQVNIAIMRTFVQLRRLMDGNADLARKIESLEKKYDEKFAAVFTAIKQLIAPSAPAKKRIGFHP